MRPRLILPCCILSALALSSSGIAQPRRAPPFSLSDTVYLPGYRAVGAFDVWNRQRCSVADFQKEVGVAVLEDSDEFTSMSTGDRLPRKATIAEHAREATTKLNRALDALRANGDKLVGARNLCVGYLPYLTTPSLVSSPSGFIAVDPTVVARIPRSRTGAELAEELLYFHALSHQLQLWSDQRFAGDPTTRRRELQADCVAGALAVLIRLDGNSLGGLGEIDQVNRAVQAASNELADLASEEPSPPWTGRERRVATMIGSMLVAKEASDNAPAVARPGAVRTVSSYTSTLTGRRLLDICARYIQKSDGEQGTPWRGVTSP